MIDDLASGRAHHPLSAIKDLSPSNVPTSIAPSVVHMAPTSDKRIDTGSVQTSSMKCGCTLRPQTGSDGFSWRYERRFGQYSRKRHAQTAQLRCWLYHRQKEVFATLAPRTFSAKDQSRKKCCRYQPKSKIQRNGRPRRASC